MEERFTDLCTPNKLAEIFEYEKKTIQNYISQMRGNHEFSKYVVGPRGHTMVSYAGFYDYWISKGEKQREML
ncbi:hypothetical protein F4V47_10040 [Lactococcus garvieae subsp. garvieae]|uniref:Uncharacterized protein n=1 Tax=Lactococcus garvieae TaxID=1363 RepID=A0AA46TV08_9LACT|nr:MULTISPECIES: hypothetical protein [Lactococcus]KAA8710244.1 hypothetical protein F4V47_10040 [Lactococcus garvieae subsp. garvieae]KXT59637.1 hypothetical protein LACDD01_01982 [Lactococcus sp. DD01]MDG6191791.1 hypothetical protein [Lactococcus garvieae]PCS02065.1 hypothetical protein RU85_GL000197 [Lactococcus garvieae]QPR49296.1 hypothetical protein I6G86_02180 [Lactococcus garvieae]